MPTINISQLTENGDAVVIHFAVEGQRINAYTLASTLVGIADAAKAANASLNIGYDVEIVVEALGPGSFRAMLRAVYKEAHNLFSREPVKAIIWGIVSTFIYEHTLAPSSEIKVEIRTEEVIIQNGKDRVIVPRNVYDATQELQHNTAFVQGINKSVQAITADEDITGIGFVSRIDSPPPDLVISRDALQTLEFNLPEEPDTRVIEEQVHLHIVKAILEASSRKWEFMWRGVKISAPVVDKGFYDRFYAHNIRIAPGDELEVRLAIRQARDPRTGIYTNVSYVVLQVFNHIWRVRQTNIGGDN
ncbi:MAG: hypothetical protein ABIR70_02265 [Bryobacteraceae bacterium]